MQYLDANNLYGWSMSQVTGGRICMGPPTIDEVIQTPDDSDEGYIIEVDLEYPKELHALHNDYPLAPETMAIKQEWLSQYQHDLVNQLGCKFLEDSVKLVPNLLNKERYVLHYRNLKLYHELGMQV